MSRVRIEELGYENYTGDFGGVQFEDGVSIEDLSKSEVNRLSAAVRLVDVDSEEQLGVCVEMIKLTDADMPIVADSERGEEGPVVLSGQERSETGANANAYTREALEGIADSEGIAGLRKIGDEFNVKSTSIHDLIDKILAAQAGG